MRIEMSSSLSIGLNASVAQSAESAQSLLKGCSTLAKSVKGLLGASPSSHGLDTPTLHRFMSKVLAAQRLVLSEAPSSSNDQRLQALDALESRGLQPLNEGALKLRVTGKALGGMSDRATGGGYASNRDTLEALYSQLDDFTARRDALQSQIDSLTASTDDVRDNIDMYSRQGNQAAVRAYEATLRTNMVQLGRLEDQKREVNDQITRTQSAIYNM